MLPDALITRFLQETNGLSSWGRKKVALIEFMEANHLWGWECEHCGEYAEGVQGHHAILSRDKNSKIPDVVWNMMLVCRDCNVSRAVDNMETRRKFLHKRLEMFGKGVYQEWFAIWPELYRESRTEIYLMMERMVG